MRLLVVAASAALLCALAVVVSAIPHDDGAMMHDEVAPLDAPALLEAHGGVSAAIDMSQHSVARHEQLALLETQQIDYDSGGCTPLTVWEDWVKAKKGSEWWQWEDRLPELAKATKGMSENERASYVFKSLGKNAYLQYLDGRSHLEGPNAFGKEYIGDMLKAQALIDGLLKSGTMDRKHLNVKFYDDLHTTTFSRTAGLLKKTNGFRGKDSWIYLPLPDKPLGIFHDIHYKGKVNFDQKLRIVTRLSEHPIKGWKWNRGYQWRWRYPNLPEEEGRAKVQEIFDYFWNAIDKIPANKSEGAKRAAKLTAIVWLYHALENFHCFIDGNGRTNVMVMQALLCWAGLHPISFYNSMESALTAWEEEREVVLEGYLKWETGYQTGKTGWTLEEVDRKRQECQVAVDKLTKSRSAADRKKEFQPDTLGGCMCKTASSCDSNEQFAGQSWCYTDNNCVWGWDYCAEGRSSK